MKGPSDELGPFSKAWRGHALPQVGTAFAVAQTTKAAFRSYPKLFRTLMNR